MAVPELDPIRDKIEFLRRLDAPLSFKYASLDSFPSATERPLIAKWATLRDACIAPEHAINPVPSGASPLDESFIRQEMAFGAEAEGKVSELVIALYHQKLTYGKFAQRRYDGGKAAVDAGRQYREAQLIVN